MEDRKCVQVRVVRASRELLNAGIAKHAAPGMSLRSFPSDKRRWQRDPDRHWDARALRRAVTFRVSVSPTTATVNTAKGARLRGLWTGKLIEPSNTGGQRPPGPVRFISISRSRSLSLASGDYCVALIAFIRGSWCCVGRP